jgi:hypothetical protein
VTAMIHAADGFINVTADDCDLVVSFYDDRGRFFDSETVTAGKSRSIAIRGTYYRVGQLLIGNRLSAPATGSSPRRSR